jgi:hypothetical protein
MGFSSWNAVSSNVTEAYMRNITQLLISSGLAAKGYIYVNIDSGWLGGRYNNGTIYEILEKFPRWVCAVRSATGGLLRRRHMCRGQSPWRRDMTRALCGGCPLAPAVA